MGCKSHQTAFFAFLITRQVSFLFKAQYEMFEVNKGDSDS